MRLAHATALYLLARRGELAALTLRTHRYRLEDLTLFLGADVALKAIRPRHIQEWISAHTTWAPSTARTNLGVARTFFSWCHANGHTKTNPTATLRGPRPPRQIPRELEAVDVHKVLDAAPDLRARAILSLMFHEGLRRVEVWGLDVGDLDGEIIQVAGKGGHQRVLPLSAHSSTAIHAYLSEHPTPSGALFRSYHNGQRLHPDTIGILVSRTFADSGVKKRAHDGKSGHAARHTYAGQMLDNGADIRIVAAALGHQHITTTAIYLKRRQTVADIRPFTPDYGASDDLDPV